MYPQRSYGQMGIQCTSCDSFENLLALKKCEKVKFALEQVMKAQRENTDIILLSLTSELYGVGG